VAAGTRENRVQRRLAADNASSHWRPCPACAGDRKSLLGWKNGYPLRQCARCFVVFTEETTESKVLADLYDHYYDNASFCMNSAAAASLDSLAKSFAGHRETGRWLDIGFGEGGMLAVAERHGWSCYGTELSPAALAHGKRRSWVVAADADTDPRFVRQGFDIVTMIELLEHLPTPVHLLFAAARWLRPGGLLYITTPNARSLNRCVLGLNWSVVSPPEHLVLWTAVGLRKCLARAGFAVQAVRTDGFNPFEIVDRLRGPRSAAPSRNSAGFAMNEAFSSSSLRRGLKRGINCLLSLFRLGDTLKVLAVRRNS
jgi:2-polyprenyl-3-methyl-5-hydroxy-6-metoxy-1,4-benzoquinol methylase